MNRLHRAVGLLLLLTAGTPVFAQKKSPVPDTATAARKRLLKPVLGSNYAVLSGKGLRSQERNLGIGVGLLVEVPSGKRNVIETGLMYSSTKSTVARDIRWRQGIQGGTGMAVNETSAYHFLRLPVSYLVRLKGKDPWFVGVGTGAAINFTARRSGRETSSRLPGDGYRDRFAMNSRLGMPVGIFGTAMAGKEFTLGGISTGVRLEYTYDATGWKYPTAGRYEDESTYSMTGHNLSANLFFKF